jgi:hypothetical protein
LLKGSWASSRGSQSSFLAALDLVGATQNSVNDKGELVTPWFPGLNGAQRHWIEYAPFVWRDRDSHERLGAQVVDGKAVRFSVDEFSPFIVFDRPAWYRNPGWLRPAFFVSVTILLLTALFWPITAIVRRRYGAALTLDRPSLRAYTGSKIAAVAIVVAVAMWCTTIGLMIADLSNFSAQFDLVIHFAQLLGIVAFIGGFVLTLLNLRAVWIGQRRWPAKTWSVLLATSGFIVLWVAFAFNLIGLGANY